MPLNTQIVVNGETLSLRWGDFHIAAMTIASAIDAGKFPCEMFKKDPRPEGYPETAIGIGSEAWTIASYPYIAASPLNVGEYVLKNDHKFEDLTDGEVLVMPAGTTLRAWRN